MKLTETQILATTCEVHVTEGGFFEVYLLGQAEVEGAQKLAGANTFSDAVEKAKPEVRKRKVKVRVEYYRLAGDRYNGLKFQPGVATGFHAGTGNVMATEHSDSKQIATSGYRSDKLYRGDMPDETRGEFVKLRTEVNEREERLRELEKQWTVDLAAAVTEAITASMAPQE